MDLLQLEHFLAVVDEGTFTRAAERVRRTQPAVSQSIKKLEDELGTPLFARDVHDVSLTEAGKVLAEHARRMVRARDDAMRELGALKTLQAGTLSIAAHESAAVYLLPAPLRHYLHQHPDVKVGIYRSALADIPRQVLDREVHVGFVKDVPPFRELQWVEVHMDDTVVIAHPGHPLAGRSGVRVSDLGQERFVVHHMCSTTEAQIRRIFEQRGTPWHIAAELWSFENVKSFVRAEVGLAIVPRMTVAEDLEAGLLAQVVVSELAMPRRTLMLFRDDGYLSDAARELIKVVREFARSMELRV